jgi:hypothetical protein
MRPLILAPQGVDVSPVSCERPAAGARGLPDAHMVVAVEHIALGVVDLIVATEEGRKGETRCMVVIPVKTSCHEEKEKKREREREREREERLEGTMQAVE